MNLPPWTPCDCGEFWCTIHGGHAHECACPPIEEWETDPYTAKEERPRTMTTTTTRPATVRCGMCDTTATREYAIETGWVASYYDGDHEVLRPTCPKCAAAHLTVGKDGEIERK
jgi:hypothetical protein